VRADFRQDSVSLPAAEVALDDGPNMAASFSTDGLAPEMAETAAAGRARTARRAIGDTQYFVDAAP
jgi:hypothetical protein